MTDTVNIETVIESGAEIFVPLNKLKKSPRNARKTPHSEAHVEALAASIAVKGMLQNLVVEPEQDAGGGPTGSYFVTIGEGRRLAQLLRAKRKQIKKTEPIRCILDTENDPQEISLDENVTREAMHPADQFERFRELSERKGWGAEEIAARFGVTPHVVRQRLRLGAVSSRLMQVYRDGGLTLDQLMAFAIVEDHTRQEQVYDNLSYNRDPLQIRRDLTRMHIAATDRRVIFVGPEAYTTAGGIILRDLCTEDRGGFYEDVALLDRLVIEKLERVAAEVQAEGWKWTSVHIDHPYAHGLRRSYPQLIELSAEDQAAYEAAQAEYDALTEQYDSAEELPDDVDQRFEELEAEIERINAMRHAYDPDDIGRGGVFVVPNHDGTARIERGFIRPEDEKPESEPEAEADSEGYAVSEDGEIIEDGDEDRVSATETEDEEAEDDSKPLSDLLIRDLTAHRTLGLRLALGEQPDMALIAVTHALAAQTFYRAAEASRDDAERLSLIVPGRDEPVSPTHWSFGQLCSLVSAPASYMRQLPAPLAGINLQHGLLSHRAELVKTLEADDGRIELRAVTGPEYGRIWDHELVAAVMKIAGNGTGDTRWKVPGVLDWATMMHNPFVFVRAEGDIGGG
jgi:ParB family chromosome partitioning protein